VKRKQKILIIVEKSDVIVNLAEKIAAVLKKPPYAQYSIKIVEAKKFSATDLLPAYVFFIGCENPGCFTSLYPEDLFAHINLAGRSCGIFSTTSGGIKYLTNLVRASEACTTPLLVKDGNIAVREMQKWIKIAIQPGGEK
jgi:hypothetical protein